MYSVQVEYGVGAYASHESCDGFDSLEDAYDYAEQALNEVSALIREGDLADNAVIRVWRDDKNGPLIGSSQVGEEV